MMTIQSSTLQSDLVCYVMFDYPHMSHLTISMNGPHAITSLSKLTLRVGKKCRIRILYGVLLYRRKGE